MNKLFENKFLLFKCCLLCRGQTVADELHEQMSTKSPASMQPKVSIARGCLWSDISSCDGGSHGVQATLGETEGRETESWSHNQKTVAQ